MYVETTLALPIHPSMDIQVVSTFWPLLTSMTSAWEICMQVRKHQLELDMEQQTGSK